MAKSTPNTASQPPKANSPLFFQKNDNSWQSLVPSTTGTPEEQEKEQKRSVSAKKSLHEQLLSSLQMQHVIVLAGSGTSLGPTVGGPSMWTLWDHCVNSNPDSGSAARTKTANIAKVIVDVGYDQAVSTDKNKDNIEALLSQCEAYLQCKPNEKHISDFVSKSREIIIKKCSEFIDSNKPDQLAAHRMFLHKLSRRRVRDSRLKLFTTNYDLCFENAAAKQGLVAIDGFSFSQPRFFDSRYYQYDIIRRTAATGELGAPLEGVFQYFKLHGSVNWRRVGESIVIDQKPNANDACLIYPAKGKYQQSYSQPHLEVVSEYFASLREPNTCVVTIGFGFNDDHLSEPILAAVKTNPHLRLIVVSPTAQGCSEGTQENTNKYWTSWLTLAKSGADILLIAATFDEFTKEIPDLKTLTPAEQLAKNVAVISGGK